MIDVLILNRNLGEVCDALVADLSARLSTQDTLTVIDSGSDSSLKSRHTTIHVADKETREHGLRFNRGMNVGLQYRRENGLQNPWVLMLPVDSEIINWELRDLLELASRYEKLVAIKPIGVGSGYANGLTEGSLKLAWNVEEGPWLVRDSFIEEQIGMSPRGDFFDHDNFRGYLTGLDLSFRALANGHCVGITNCLAFHENESYLLERADLIKTEALHLHTQLMISEGADWLRGKYGIDDAWSFAQIVRLLHAQFNQENPDYGDISRGVFLRSPK